MSRGRQDPSYALLLALLVMMTLSAAAFLVIAQMHLRLASALDESRNVHLRVLVDSGVALSLGRISEDRDFAGPIEQRLNRGTVRCDVASLGGSRRRVRIQAEYGGERRTYVAEVSAPKNRPVRLLSLLIAGARPP